jgi:AraC-like DNA-binding protein
MLRIWYPIETLGDTGVAAKLPFTHFSTSHLADRDRFAVWRESIAVLYDVALPDGRPAEEFQASIGAHLLEGLFVSNVSFSAQRFFRDRRRVAADGIDHYQIQLYLKGGESNAEREMRPGDIQILDLGCEHLSHTQDSDSIVIMAARDSLRDVLPGSGPLHQTILRRETGSGGLLGDYMRSLAARLPSMTEAEANSAAQATSAVIGACFRPTADALAQAREPIDCVVVDRAKRYIESHLASPELEPDAICRALGVSRSRLYTLFEVAGGVARYIRTRRLLRAYRELCHPARRAQSTGEIAYRWGFTSPAHFARLFRAAFGESPSDVRSRPVTPGAIARAAAMASGDGYEEWIRRRLAPGIESDK